MNLIEQEIKAFSKMSHEELKKYTEYLLIELVTTKSDLEDLQRRYDQNSSDYLSRCTSSGGVTLPPNCS